MAETHPVETRQVGRTLGRRNHVIRRHREIEVRQVHFDERRAVGFDRSQRRLDGCSRLLIETGVKVLPHDADAQAIERTGQARRVIGHGPVDTRRVARIESGHHAKQ